MASFSGLNISRGNLYQEIDLEEVLGIDLSRDPLLVQSIGQSIIDFMRDRTTKENVDRHGKKFAPYSSSYKKSDDYIAAGKSSAVDMELRGFMLNSMDFEASGSTVRLGFDDPEEQEKAYGHMTGMDGHKVLDGKTPKREFFGISNEDLSEMVERKFSDDLEAIRQQSAPAQDLDFDGLSFGSATTPGTTVTLDDLLGGSLFGDEEF